MWMDEQVLHILKVDITPLTVENVLLNVEKIRLDRVDWVYYKQDPILALSPLELVGFLFLFRFELVIKK